MASKFNFLVLTTVLGWLSATNISDAQQSSGVLYNITGTGEGYVTYVGQSTTYPSTYANTSWGYTEKSGGPSISTSCLSTLKSICVIDGKIQQPPLGSNAIVVTGDPWSTETCGISVAGNTINIRNTNMSGVVYPEGHSNYSISFAATIDVNFKKPSLSRSTYSSYQDDNYYYIASNGVPHGGRTNQIISKTGSGIVLQRTNVICGEPDFRLVALNPFWLYPFGAQSIDLNNVAKEISSPGGTIPAGKAALLRAGTPIATGISVDGVSKFIVGVATGDTKRPVTFTLSQSGRGTLGRLTKNFFSSSPAAGISYKVNPPFIDIPGNSDLKVAAVVFMAPKMKKNFSDQTFVSIEATQGREKQKLDVSLRPPPLLLVHGLWSSGSAWAKFLSHLDASKFPGHLAITYASSEAFHTSQNLDTFRSGIATLLGSARRLGVVSTQVNVVGHSMGGLLARRAALEADYRRPENLGAGDIHQLITLDSPHLGSNLAKLLWDKRDTTFRREDYLDLLGNEFSTILLKNYLRGKLPESISLSQLFGVFDHEIDSAITSLISPNKYLSGNGVNYETLGSQASGDGAVVQEFALNAALKMVGSTAGIDGLLTKLNDLIVSLQSQKSGGTTGSTLLGPTHSTVFFGVAGTGVLDDERSAHYVQCRLFNGDQCVQPNSTPFSGGMGKIRTASIRGLRREPDENLDLVGVNSIGLNLNESYTAQIQSAVKTIVDFSYAIKRSTGFTYYEGDPSNLSITFELRDRKPLEISVIAKFSDQTYATRSFLYKPDPGIRVSLLHLQTDLVYLSGIGATAKLEPIAYLTLPDKGYIDVSAVAEFRVLSGRGVVRLTGQGRLVAVRPGVARVSATYGGKRAVVDVIVSK